MWTDKTKHHQFVNQMFSIATAASRDEDAMHMRWSWQRCCWILLTNIFLLIPVIRDSRLYGHIFHLLELSCRPNTTKDTTCTVLHIFVSVLQHFDNFDNFGSFLAFLGFSLQSPARRRTHLLDRKTRSQKVKSIFCGFFDKRSGSRSPFLPCKSEKYRILESEPNAQNLK